LGKDLSRATDEIQFYEEAKRNSDSRDVVEPIAKFFFKYLGVLKTKEEGSSEVLELLVLENLFDGKETLRLVDIKIGEKTASANWKGKGYFRAMRQQLFDKGTNSSREGFRLEGFDGSPPSLNCLETFVEGIFKDKSSRACKKSRRLLYQGLSGNRIVHHLFDLHDSLEEHAGMFTVDEYLEIIMHETVKLLTQLAVGCHIVKFPQKWIGSSLALGFDCASLPSRANGEHEIRQSVICKIFDWGRSELNTTAIMKELSISEIEDRREVWDSYKSAMNSLSWITCNNYFGRFCCGKWDRVTFEIYDFDTLSHDDFMCRATIPVRNMERVKIPLTRRNGKGGGTISYAMEYKSCTNSSSRLSGSWKIKIYEAENLPNMDLSLFSSGTDAGMSDPFIIIKAESNDGRFNFEQVTKMVVDDLNPTWNEVLSLPVAKSNEECFAALQSVGLDCSHGEVSETLEDWSNRVKVLATKSVLSHYSTSTTVEEKNVLK
jgi:hypothetical protein